MKYKTTKKETQSNYRNIIRIGYADLQFLLKFTEPTAYTHGVYGWNADIYDFDNVAIVTGYRPFGNYKMDWDLMNEYEDKAKAINNNRTLEYEERKNKVNALLNEVIEFIKEDYRKKKEGK